MSDTRPVHLSPPHLAISLLDGWSEQPSDEDFARWPCQLLLTLEGPETDVIEVYESLRSLTNWPGVRAYRPYADSLVCFMLTTWPAPVLEAKMLCIDRPKLRLKMTFSSRDEHLGVLQMQGNDVLLETGASRPVSP